MWEGCGNETAYHMITDVCSQVVTDHSQGAVPSDDENSGYC